MAVDHDERLKRADELEKTLSPGHRRYCEARAAGFSQRKSAMLASYSSRSAHVTASRIERRPEVAEYIELLRSGYLSDELGESEIGQKILAKVEKRESFSRFMEGLFQRLVRDDCEVAFGDPADIFDISGGAVRIKDFTELTPAQRRRIVGFKYHNLNEGGCELVVQLQDPCAAKVRLYRVCGYETAKAVARVKKEKEREEKESQDSNVNEGGLTKKTAEDMRREIFGIKQ